VDFSVLLSDIPTLLLVILGVPAVLAAYIVGGEYLVRRLPDKNRPQVRPWIWVGPALIFYTLFALAFGLLLAVLFDRVPYESFVKSLIFMPMAISSVALGVIWKFMFWYQPAGEVQTGTMNALVTFFHHEPVAWLQDLTVNNLALILAAGWGITGFSMVILSAALKGIPGDLLEAARVDGAGEITIFRRVIFPLMMPTVVVVGTTLVIFALKAFDIVYVMTGGNYDT